MSEDATVATTTRERLLLAAERLLLTGRYDDVSVRSICAEASANPAAVHYHFGSKEELVTALLEDRLGPLWAAPLSTVTAEHGSVDEIVATVIGPFLELAADPVGRLHLQLLAQFVHGRQAIGWSKPWFRLDSWASLLPGVGERESRRRWMLAFDLIIMRFGRAGAEERAMSPEAADALHEFVVAGLTAPTRDTR
jgi:AcrR family transcriptional regulator